MSATEHPSWSGRPTFLGIGAEKTGSTSLHRYLGQHPDIFVPTLKEPGFFAADDTPLVRDPVAYRALFEGADTFRIRGEVSARYLHSAAAPAAIRAELPDVLLIGFLRDPVERAYSHYLMLMASHEIVAETDFGAAVRGRLDHSWQGSGDLITEYCLRRSLYAESISRYHDLFGADRVRFYRYEDLDDEPERVMADIFRFLGADDGFKPDLAERHNVSSGVSRLRTVRHFILRDTPVKRVLQQAIPGALRNPMRRFVMQHTRPEKPGLRPDVRALLAERYLADVERVESLLGMDLRAWKP